MKVLQKVLQNFKELQKALQNFAQQNFLRCAGGTHHELSLWSCGGALSTG